jgi:hypothetical protein
MNGADEQIRVLRDSRFYILCVQAQNDCHFVDSLASPV